MFAVQGEIARAIIAAAGLEIRDEVRERIRSRRPAEIGAYDAYLAAGASMRRNTHDGIREARRLAERALALDPDYGPALTTLAHTFPAAKGVMAFAQWRAGRPEEALRLWEEAARTSPDQVPVLLSLAARYESLGRHDEARAAVAQIRRVNPDLRVDQIGAACPTSFDAEELVLVRESLRRAGPP